MDRQGPVRSLEIVESEVFAPGRLELGQLTVLTGLHGAGKSHALVLLREALPQWQSLWDVPPIGPRREVTLTAAYDVVLAQGVGGGVEHVVFPIETNYGRHAPTAATELQATWLDAHEVRSLFPLFDSGVVYPRTPAVGTPVAAAISAAMCQILGHTYTELSVALVDTDGGDFPEFRGRRDGAPISTWTMSSAEFWVSYILWVLSWAAENELVIIDEPETSLSSPGHQAFLDEIARLTLKQGCQTIVATHSETMIRRTPVSMLRVVLRADEQSTFERVDDVETLLRSLRRDEAPVRRIVLVEDMTAQAMTLAALRRFAPSAVAFTEIVVADGSSNVVSGVRALAHAQRVAVAGVLDGDAQDDAHGQVFKLPGGAPEVELARAARSNVAAVAVELDAKRVDVLMALDASRHEDHQRFFTSLAAKLSTRNADQVRDVLVRNWAAQEALQLELDRLVAAIIES
ncbi:hypothetical protein [Microbacterium sp. 2MCAF23]|uniref:hypothetical protein n=1 Tax=Microbacterium sp. 2MCAF23 TaxID=3232985 RepID=UPI003F951FD9